MGYQFIAVKHDITRFIDARWMREVGLDRVHQILVVCPDVAVHCCSLTPSVEAWPAGYTYESDRDLSDEVRESIEEEFSRWGVDDQISYFGGVPKGETHDLGEFDGDDYADAARAAEEHYRANPRW